MNDGIREMQRELSKGLVPKFTKPKRECISDTAKAAVRAARGGAYESTLWSPLIMLLKR